MHKLEYWELLLKKWTEESKRKWALQILRQDVGSAHVEAQAAHWTAYRLNAVSAPARSIVLSSRGTYLMHKWGPIHKCINSIIAPHLETNDVSRICTTPLPPELHHPCNFVKKHPPSVLFPKGSPPFSLSTVRSRAPACSPSPAAHLADLLRRLSRCRSPAMRVLRPLAAPLILPGDEGTAVRVGRAHGGGDYAGGHDGGPGCDSAASPMPTTTPLPWRLGFWFSRPRRPRRPLFCFPWCLCDWVCVCKQKLRAVLFM
jgi:hypothetical protein